MGMVDKPPGRWHLPRLYTLPPKSPRPSRPTSLGGATPGKWGQKEGPRPGGAGGLGRRWADPGFVEGASRPGGFSPLMVLTTRDLMVLTA